MRDRPDRPGFPFSAVVGLDDLRLALLLNAVHPGVGGVLVRGEKGTAKSTAVRALAALLPAVDVVRRLPLLLRPGRARPGLPATARTPAAGRGRGTAGPAGRAAGRRHRGPARRLARPRAGAVRGRQAYEPGLLAAAHRGVLYVDEVNLLHDHLVDLLLDAAAHGPRPTSSARASRCRTRPGSCWSAR